MRELSQIARLHQQGSNARTIVDCHQRGPGLFLAVLRCLPEVAAYVVITILSAHIKKSSELRKHADEPGMQSTMTQVVCGGSALDRLRKLCAYHPVERI